MLADEAEHLLQPRRLHPRQGLPRADDGQGQRVDALPRAVEEPANFQFVAVLFLAGGLKGAVERFQHGAVFGVFAKEGQRVQQRTLHHRGHVAPLGQFSGGDEGAVEHMRLHAHARARPRRPRCGAARWR